MFGSRYHWQPVKRKKIFAKSFVFTFNPLFLIYEIISTSNFSNMKKIMIPALLFVFSLSTTVLFAQEEPATKEKSKTKESQEIIIRKKGDKDVSVNIEIKGDKILVNGKPLVEFKDDNIIINNRKMFVRDGEGNMSFNYNNEMIPMKIRGFGGINDTSFWKMAKGEKRALLGVNTEKAEDGSGAKISSATADGGAGKAGLKSGDVIVRIDDKKIEGPADLTEVIHAKKPGEVITIHYKREGKEKSTKATLGETTSSDANVFSFSGPGMGKLNGIGNMENYKEMMAAIPQFRGSGDWNTENFSGNMMNMSRRPKIGLKIQDVEEGSGVKVLDAEKDSPADKAGLKKDDVIIEINGKKVDNTDEAREQLKPEEGKNSFSIKVKRNGSDMSFEVKIPKKLKTADL